MAAYIVKPLSSVFLRKNWPSFSVSISCCFKDATFNSGFDVNKVLDEIKNEVFKEPSCPSIHFTISNQNEEMIAGIFCIAGERPRAETDCDVGWFFTSPLINTKSRIELAEILLNKTHSHLKNWGSKE